VVYVQAIKKKAILRQIVAGAAPSGIPVVDALMGFQTSIASSNLLKGRILISTSGSGQSGSFEIGLPGKEFTQDNIFALSEQLIEIYEFALASSSANGSPLTDDGTAANSAAIMAVMREDDRLQSVNRKGADMTLLGFPQIGQLTT
jgi:hypothetical protein